MQQQYRYFLLALGFFTRIPVPSFNDFQEAELNQSAKYFPLVGVIVGISAAVLFYLAALILPHSIAVLISMAGTIYLTGAFHEDGLADSADGLGGGWEKERILTIMQDSRLGTYGAVALLLMLLAKFQTLTAMDAFLIPATLISAHAISRLCAIWMMRDLPYVKSSGKAKPLATEINLADTLLAHVFGLLPLLCVLVLFVAYDYPLLSVLLYLVLTLVPMALVWWWWRNKIRFWLGGYTGDTLGATQQMTELAYYLGVLAWSISL